MPYIRNTTGNAISFLISLALHTGAAYGLFFVSAKDETLLAEKNKATQMMAISLNQISPIINNENSMQATEQLASQAITPPAEPEPTPEPPKDELKDKLKEEPKPEPLKPIEKPKPKPRPKPKEKPKIIEKVVQKEPEPVREPIKEPVEQAAPPTPVALPASQSLAHNEAVSQGGAPQSGQSTSTDIAQARTVLGEIHAAILKHKTYPKRAINSRMEGRAQVSFLLTSQCEFQNLEVLKSSTHEFLDKHAMATIKRACKDFPVEAIGMNLKVIIAFNLKDIE